jgi:hypothetical protein
MLQVACLTNRTLNFHPVPGGAASLPWLCHGRMCRHKLKSGGALQRSTRIGFHAVGTRNRVVGIGCFQTSSNSRGVFIPTSVRTAPLLDGAVLPFSHVIARVLSTGPRGPPTTSADAFPSFKLAYKAGPGERHQLALSHGPTGRADVGCSIGNNPNPNGPLIQVRPLLCLSCLIG